MSESFISATDGPVQVVGGTYLRRKADEDLYKACKAGKFAYILASRQIGKSSLMLETARRLGENGFKTALIDLNIIGQNVTRDTWYLSLIKELANRLNLHLNVQQWWDERERLSASTQRFLEFLHEIILKRIPDRIVIFIDEIDVTLELGFITDDFFAAIRAVHNERAQYTDYKRLTFVLAGVATPDELIGDNARTPFNIGQAIILNDFSKAECEPLRLEIEAKCSDCDNYCFDQIYDWTNGHPYLTQKLCATLLEEVASPFVEDYLDLVDSLVKRGGFLDPRDRGDTNIQFVQDRATRDRHVHDMLRTYKRILEQESIPDDKQSPAIIRLKLYGLVVNEGGKLKVRNKLYAYAFDVKWVDEMLANIRWGLPSRYKILQEVGQGSFATLYLAQIQDSRQTQIVALKVLKSFGVNDTMRIKRFKQEARAVAKLEHPNIIRIFETSDDEEPSFIAMEYVPGGTLRDKLIAGPLSRNEAMKIVRQIGAALIYAHEKGITHCNVNPDNVLLDASLDPEHPRPVLTDFGLIKLLSQDDPITSIMGTLDYIAPEQWKQETSTPATDVYALGITFFEMLSGKCPFDVVSFSELAVRHNNEPLPLLSNVAPKIGPFFDDVLRRATAKKLAERFGNIIDFIEALEAANTQAEEVERIAQQEQVAKLVEGAQGYIQKGGYNPDRALAMIEGALEIYPGYPPALCLRGKVWLQQGQLEKALEDYQQAYEQKKNPSSEIGLEYLEFLNHIAEIFWQRQQFPEAVKHYQTIWQILTNVDNQTPLLQEIWQKTRTRLAEYYHQGGDLAYASGHPERIDEAIGTLKEKTKILKALGAEHEADDLERKLRRLQVSRYEEIIKVVQATIGEFSTRDSQARFVNEDIFQHYATLDEAYQALSELEPENRRRSEDRRKRLREWAESRSIFAARALAKLEPDYEAALRHYKAVLDLEQTKYPGLTQELHLDLDKKIAELTVNADYDGKYNEVRKLMESGEYLKALEHLDQEFIRTGNYEHRDVARLLWGLIYSKQHEGEFPPEWQSLSGFVGLSKRLVNVERGRIQQLRSMLEPWSQAQILNTIAYQNKLLAAYEEQVREMEALLGETMAHGVAETPVIEQSRNELTNLTAQIQSQRNAFYQIDINATVQQVETWLQKIDDIHILLSTGNPIKDIPEFFERIDLEQQIIEKDSLPTTLQALKATNSEIGQILDQIKLQIRNVLVSILIDDLGRRDEALIIAQKESANAKEKLTEAQKELNTLRPLQGKFEKLDIQITKLNRQSEVNRYVIPIALILAIIVGAIIAPQMQNLPGLSIIITLALILLIVYFVYYIWMYYLSKSSNK